MGIPDNRCSIPKSTSLVLAAELEIPDDTEMWLAAGLTLTDILGII